MPQHQSFALRHLQFAVECLEQAGLSGTYFAYEVDELALAQFKVYMLEHAQFLLAHFHILVCYQRIFHCFPCSRALLPCPS